MYLRGFFCLIFIFIAGAVGEFCFRNRVPSGQWGQCQERIHNIDTTENCCQAGGTGWTTKANGKRCRAACLNNDPPPVVQPVQPNPQPNPPQPAPGEVKFCFRTRQPNGRFGICEDLIGEHTQEDCCRQGGKGWTDRENGRRCEDVCEGVVDDGPVQHCFRRRKNGGRCVQSFGQKTRLDCCQEGGIGWSANANGQDCDNPCELAPPAPPPEPDEPIQYCFSHRSNSGRCSRPLGEKTRSQCCQDGGNGWSANQNGRRCESPCQGPPVVLAPINGEWSEWSNWGQCSVTCQEGIQTRQRTCDNPPPAHGGNNCVGPPLEQAVCDEGPCPIHGGWGNWQDAGECSATCFHDGQTIYRQRRRECNNPRPRFGGRQCQGPALRNERCTDLPRCPVDGGWSRYGAWSPCSQTCEEGIQIRRRTCTNPRPEFGGRDCEGPDREQQICRNRRICPIHGGWSDWGAWSPCDSPRCGVDGSRFRSRSCTNPKPRHRGDYCVGPIIDRETCSKCIIPGEWSDWGPWGPCSGSCRRGDFRLRFRICNNPPPQNGGSCEGDYREFGDCENLDPCPNNIDEGSGSGSGSGDGEDDPVDHVHWPCDDEDSCNPSPERVGVEEEGSFSYSLGGSIDVPTDVPPIPDGCQDYSLYSIAIACEDNNVNEEDADGGNQVEKSVSYDYSNLGNLPQGNPDQGNPNNEGDESYDYYDSVEYGNPGQGNGGHGGPQVGVPQGAEEESVHYSDSYSFDNKGVQAQPVLPPPAGSDGGGSEPDSYDGSF